jgi:formate hydrogenlyase transcriptional activator
MIMSHGPLLDGAALLSPVAHAAPAAVVLSDATLEEMERAHIQHVLEGTRWVIEGDRGAARILGLNPSTLRGRLRKLGIRKTS